MDDWAEQSTRMAEIYGNSYATILAAIHPDSSVGVFPGRVPLESITVPFRPSVSDAKPWGSVQLVERPSDWNALSGRAWAFQEKEFAFRTFEFRSEGVSFRCRYGISREWERPTPTESHSLLFHSHKDTTSLVPSLGSPKDFPGVFIKWYGDLPAYTSLGLSYEEDRLPAISGLVKEYQSFIGGRYLAGLWEKDFIYGLQWRVRRSEDRPLRGNRRYERAPSWSWVSVQWQCYYCWPFLKRENSVNENAEEISRFLEITIEPATKDPNGRVKGGKLVIEAPLRRARWFKKHGWRIPMNKNDEHNEWDGTALFAAEEDGDDHNARAESSKPDHYSSAIAICLFDDDDERPELVECLLLTKRQGVLLALLDKTANTYRRIGFFRINGKESGLQKWLGRTETVTIV
ncbi:hypothetical protein EV356DRAFT_515796 [Viridothelium virens]|uniref:Heterokaryon incompatibility domain-containing protein n=1 Tax=Viridothelium virens TaxID=1048519 RepID=A0A6A6H7Y0_VIRVR|nr:hypothetical protein EV356DRAFT_515796 [Viridothelium virens]